MKTEILVPHNLSEEYRELQHEYMKPETDAWRANHGGWCLYELDSMTWLNEGLLTSIKPEFLAFLDSKKFGYVLVTADTEFALPKRNVMPEL